MSFKTAHHTSAPDDQLRAGTYSLLAAMLRSPPQAEILQRLKTIDTANDSRASEGEDAMTVAWGALKKAAVEHDNSAALASLDDEFHNLFIGIGRGELVPYGSWYFTGFLMDKPLSELRRDLAQLGYERQGGVREPEDHAAALCEVMAMLIANDQAPLGVQRRFFDSHLGPWAETFFLDLQQAKSARFYRAVGQLGSEFVRLEKRYLTMDV